MFSICRALLVASLALSAARAQAGEAEPRDNATDDWMQLTRSGSYAQARQRCESWLDAKRAERRAEAHKCLANVELGESGGRVLRVEGDQRSGGFIGDGYDSGGAERAVKHLDEALRLSPKDLSIHKARLHVLMLATLYSRMPQALEQSVAAVSVPADEWLSYPAELYRRRAFAPMIALLQVLERRYPDDHRIPGNLSAGFAMLEKDDEALRAAKRAVALAPDDPIDTWNLARIYDYTNELQLADEVYRRSLSLQDAAERAESTCVYAEFVSKKIKDRARACALEKSSGCPTVDCATE